MLDLSPPQLAGMTLVRRFGAPFLKSVNNETRKVRRGGFEGFRLLARIWSEVLSASKHTLHELFGGRSIFTRSSRSVAELMV